MRALFPITLFLIWLPSSRDWRRSPSLRPPRNCSTPCDWRISITGRTQALISPKRKRFPCSRRPEERTLCKTRRHQIEQRAAPSS